MDWFQANQRSHGFVPVLRYWESFPRYRQTGFPIENVRHNWIPYRKCAPQLKS